MRGMQMAALAGIQNAPGGETAMVVMKGEKQ